MSATLRGPVHPLGVWILKVSICHDVSRRNFLASYHLLSLRAIHCAIVPCLDWVPEVWVPLTSSLLKRRKQEFSFLPLLRGKEPFVFEDPLNRSSSNESSKTHSSPINLKIWAFLFIIFFQARKRSFWLKSQFSNLLFKMGNNDRKLGACFRECTEEWQFTSKFRVKFWYHLSVCINISFLSTFINVYDVAGYITLMR